jgi:hypothetical protein
MPTSDLLPGVTSRSCPPAIACDAHAAIRRARRLALLRDLLQLVLIGAVDYLFVDWPHARLPLLTRPESLQLLYVANAIILADVFVARLLPRLAARRIAETWSRAERARFTK